MNWFTRKADPATPRKIFESYMSAVNTVVCARGVIERCGPQRAVCALCFGQVRGCVNGSPRTMSIIFIGCVTGLCECSNLVSEDIRIRTKAADR